MYDMTHNIDKITHLIGELDGTASKQSELLGVIYMEIAKAYAAGKASADDKLSKMRSDQAWEAQSKHGGTM
jgi:hypothetical protein